MKEDLDEEEEAPFCFVVCGYVLKNTHVELTQTQGTASVLQVRRKMFGNSKDWLRPLVWLVQEPFLTRTCSPGTSEQCRYPPRRSRSGSIQQGFRGCGKLSLGFPKVGHFSNPANHLRSSSADHKNKIEPRK